MHLEKREGNSLEPAKRTRRTPKPLSLRPTGQGAVEEKAAPFEKAT